MQAIAVYKLIILYMLDRAGGELAVPRISTFLLENGYANFETLLKTYDEITENGFVEERVRRDKSYLRITQEGEETLGFFSNQLPEDVRQKIRAYLKDVGHEIAKEESIVGEYYRSTYGDYTVRLSVKEKAMVSSDKVQPILTIELSVPDEETAKKAVSRWNDASSDIYKNIVISLM